MIDTFLSGLISPALVAHTMVFYFELAFAFVALGFELVVVLLFNLSKRMQIVESSSSDEQDFVALDRKDRKTYRIRPLKMQRGKPCILDLRRVPVDC